MPAHDFDLHRVDCRNPDRKLDGQRDAGNLSVCGRHGEHDPIPLLDCTTCEGRSPERKSTPLFRSNLEPQEAPGV
jgi:hypothetical protein